MMKSWARKFSHKKGACGFVPTLGAMHEGHGSLIRRAQRENDRVVVSVFVNPCQFRKNQYLRYPRNLEADALLSSREGADVLFAPSARQMYPNGFNSDSSVVMPGMFKRIQSQKLGWHYRAVLVVVLKLFGIVGPDRAYFGLKDPHQLALIEKMVEDFDLPVMIRPCPTMRERDGLAFSSRNALLSPDERKAASVIYRALRLGRDEIVLHEGQKRQKSVSKVISRMEAMISASRLARAERIEIVDAATLLPLGKDSRTAMIHVSVRVGSQRLTDNLRFKLKK
ncbi:MAG: pantothenate synthetase [bacterium]|nr:MAG: pantothenate synthetase [bacterium]